MTSRDMVPQQGESQNPARSDGTSAGIQTTRLTVHYGPRCALADVTLTLEPGTITALIGPSGSGKTSFLSCLNRLTDLIPHCRVTGAIHLGSVPVLSPSTNVVELRRWVGMIFQKPNPFPLSIRRNIEFPLREHGVQDPMQRHAIVEQVLRNVGLWSDVHDRLDAPALTLSGGQQQRLCIARALALEPGILLLDEPCSSLDPRSSGTVEDLIVQLRGTYTIVMVTHNLHQARRVADQVAYLQTVDGVGRLLEYGTAEQVFEAPRKQLTVDYIREIYR